MGHDHLIATSTYYFCHQQKQHKIRTFIYYNESQATLVAVLFVLIHTTKLELKKDLMSIQAREHFFLAWWEHQIKNKDRQGAGERQVADTCCSHCPINFICLSMPLAVSISVFFFSSAHDILNILLTHLHYLQIFLHCITHCPDSYVKPNRYLSFHFFNSINFGKHTKWALKWSCCEHIWAPYFLAKIALSVYWRWHHASHLTSHAVFSYVFYELVVQGVMWSWWNIQSGCSKCHVVMKHYPILLTQECSYKIIIQLGWPGV